MVSEAFRLGNRGASEGLCETLFALEKFEEALFHCEKALELEPDKPSLLVPHGLYLSVCSLAGESGQSQVVRAREAGARWRKSRTPAA